MEEILQPVSNVKITIGERLFVSAYLPHFVNKDNRQEAIERWLEVCKNPYYPVDVLNEKNEVLFTVPPIWVRQKTRADYDGKYSLGEVIIRTQKRAEIAPKQGDAFFSECMPFIITENSTGADYTQDWNDILIRYGYLDETAKGESFIDEDFEFVDF